MEKLKSDTEGGARAECIRLSKLKYGKYVYAVANFGLFAIIEGRLHVHAPSDAIFDWYCLNGNCKTFSKSQQIADVNATPTLR